MTSRTRLPDGGRRSPGPGAPGAGRRSWASVAVIAVLVAVSAALAVRHDAAAVAVLDLVLSGIAVVGVSAVLVLARGTDRAAREQARRNQVVARGVEAVTADLRDEMLRLQSDLAHLAARVETFHRRAANRGDHR